MEWIKALIWAGAVYNTAEVLMAYVSFLIKGRPYDVTVKAVAAIICWAFYLFIL